MTRSDYTPPTFVDVPNPASPPAGAVALDAAHVNAMAQAIGNSAQQFQVNVKEYGAKGDGIADDTSTIQAALNAAGVAGGRCFVPAGNYKVTSALQLPSRVEFVGAGPWKSTITQATAGASVVVSKSYVSASGTSPGGNAAVRSLRVVGASGANSHGIVLRDYYSDISDVEVWNCGGDGIRLSAANDVGTEVSGTLVENRLVNIKTTACSGYGVNAPSSSAKVTDGMLTGCIVQAASSSAGAINFSSSSGWQIRNVHTYGTFTGPAVTVASMYATILDGLYIESGWTTAGLALYSYQRGGIVDNVNVWCGTSTGDAIHMEKAGLYTADGPTLGSLVVIQNNATAVNAVTWDSRTAYARVGRLVVQGDAASSVTPLAGFGSAYILAPGAAAYNGVLGDNTSGTTLTYGPTQLAQGYNGGWQSNGTAAVSVAFTVKLPSFLSTVGTVVVAGAQFNNGSLLANYAGTLLLSAKNNATDSWGAALTPLGTATGFTTAPAVAVTGSGDVRTVTVTFTPSSANVFGGSCALLMATQ